MGYNSNEDTRIAAKNTCTVGSSGSEEEKLAIGCTCTVGRSGGVEKNKEREERQPLIVVQLFKLLADDFIGSPNAVVRHQW